MLGILLELSKNNKQIEFTDIEISEKQKEYQKRMLGWINVTMSTSYHLLVDLMEQKGFTISPKDMSVPAGASANAKISIL